MKIKFDSLRLRFSLWVAGFLFGALLLFGVYVYASMSRNLTVAVDDGLRLGATQAAGTLNVDNGKIILADNLPENNSDMEALRARGFTVRFFDSQGKLLGGFGANWQRLKSISPGKQVALFDVTNTPGNANSRIYLQPVMDGPRIVGYIQTSQSLETVRRTLWQLLLSLALGIPFLTLLAASGGYSLAGRALKPVDEITKTARHISAEDLSARINLSNYSDELGRLASTFNDMLTRLQDSFLRERQFTADASHELRTPLAAMQTIINVTRTHRRSSNEYEEALDDLGEEAGRLRSLAEDLLLLARGEQHSRMQKEQLDFSALLENIVDSLTPLAEENGLSLKHQIQSNLTLVGDQDALIRLFVNLIDNAIKFTESGEIIVIANAQLGKVRINVVDTGKGIHPEQMKHIFDRFYRAESARTQTGSGLGLAIALQIARAHGGSIHVSSEYGEGTTFSVTLLSS